MDSVVFPALLAWVFGWAAGVLIYWLLSRKWPHLYILLILGAISGVFNFLLVLDNISS